MSASSPAMALGTSNVDWWVDVGLSHLIISLSKTLTLGLVLLLGCAKGTEIGPGEVFILLPISPGSGAPDASPAGGSEPEAEAIVLSVPDENDSAPPPSNAETPVGVAPLGAEIAPPDAGGPPADAVVAPPDVVGAAADAGRADAAAPSQ